MYQYVYSTVLNQEIKILEIEILVLRKEIQYFIFKNKDFTQQVSTLQIKLKALKTKQTIINN